MSACFHCSEALVAGAVVRVQREGVEQAFCCVGCAAVAAWIQDEGLDRYYQYRENQAARPLPRERERWEVYERPRLRQQFVRDQEDGEAIMDLQVGGMHCGACAWLIEQAMRRLEGVMEAQANSVSSAVQLRFDPRRCTVTDVLVELDRLGFIPQPLPQDRATTQRTERRSEMKRLLVAGLLAMQIMMIAIALYADTASLMDPALRDFLHWVSLLLATPVAVYAAREFHVGAAREWQAGRVGMNTPVALAVGIAFLASVHATISGAGEVYFDSLSMFVFFLLLGRFLERGVRMRAHDAVRGSDQVLPETVLLANSQSFERVALDEVRPGDRLRIGQGELVPVDGVVAGGEAAVDESLLTGESQPRRRAGGEQVLAGSLNRGDTFDLLAHATGAATMLANLQRMMLRAGQQRPRLERLADAIAGRFVAIVLLLAAGTAVFWFLVEPQRALPATLAVLIVTCPCALSLATPAALAAATGRLARSGLMVRGDTALETLAQVDCVVFDKTGTLTDGQPALVATRCLDENSGAADVHGYLNIASALEAQSTHPLAAAFPAPLPGVVATDVQQHAGAGISGRVNGRHWRLGTAAFAGAGPADAARFRMILANDDGPVAGFVVEESLRPDAAATVASIVASGLSVLMLSGDRAAAVRELAARIHVSEFKGELDPAGKLASVRALQNEGHVVAVIGDGMNDAPVLAGADVSIAMASGSPLARHSADVSLLGSSLRGIATALDTSRQARRVIRQNIAWAIAYNLLAVPLAASGLLPAWLAAIGMSASSLLVVVNSLRLQKQQRVLPALAADKTLVAT